MSTLIPTHRMKTRTLAIVVGIALIVTALIMMVSGGHITPPDVSNDGIPLPFARVESTSMIGSIVRIGQRGSMELREVSFDNDERTEILQDGTLVSRMDFVVTPDDPTIAHGAPLRAAFTPGKRLFGYIYSSRDAAKERAAMARLSSGEPVSFRELFSGTFFVSDEQRNTDDSIATFERTRGVTFLSLDAATLQKNSRMLVVSNDTNTSITARDLHWCGDGVTDEPAEQCDDGNRTTGDGCNAACVPDVCGDGVVDTDGIPDPSAPDGRIWEEQCDDGGLCVGGTHDGAACTAVAGGKAEETQCPGGGRCVPQSFDGCANNCLEEICGNGDWEIGGRDGRYGRAGIDDDNNGVIDDPSERWYAGSDDEQCDPGGACMKNGQAYAEHSCATPAEADVCRQDGGTCQPVAKGGCSATCTREIRTTLSITNAGSAPDGASIVAGDDQSIGRFTISAGALPTDERPYAIIMDRLMIRVESQNVSLGIADARLAVVGTAITAPCTVLHDDGSAVSSSTVQGTALLDCQFDTNNDRATLFQLSQSIGLDVRMRIASAALDPATSSLVQASIDRVMTDATAYGPSDSHIRWIATNTPQRWTQYRVAEAANPVRSTRYGNQPPAAVCGNHIQEGTEECDDGNNVDDDACSNTCTIVANPFF